jgi:hypothetical protein
VCVYIGQLVKVSLKIVALFMQLYRFTNIAGGHYTGPAVCLWEKFVVEKLDWYFTVPTVYMFLLRYVKAAGADEEV